MTDEHASMAASTLVERSQRCQGVSAALAEKLRTSNSPAGGIRASHRDPSNTYDLEMVASLCSRISAHAFELNKNALGSRRYPPVRSKQRDTIPQKISSDTNRAFAHRLIV